MSSAQRPRTPAIRTDAVSWQRLGDDPSSARSTRRATAGGPSTGTTVPAPVPAPRRAPAPALWAVVAGVVLSTLVAVLIDSKLGIVVLAATSAAAGTARSVLPDPGLEGITIRTRGVDAFFFFSAALGLVLLALIAPDA